MVEEIKCHKEPAWNTPVDRCTYCGQYVCGLCKVVVDGKWVCGCLCWNLVKKV